MNSSAMARRAVGARREQGGARLRPHEVPLEDAAVDPNPRRACRVGAGAQLVVAKPTKPKHNRHSDKAKQKQPQSLTVSTVSWNCSLLDDIDIKGLDPSCELLSQDPRRHLRGICNKYYWKNQLKVCSSANPGLGEFGSVRLGFEICLGSCSNSGFL